MSLSSVNEKASSVIFDDEGRPVLKTGAETGEWDASSAGIHRLAMKRLAKDYAELQETPVPMIAAEPLNSNWFKWHLNMMGPPNSPYEDTVFHMIMTIPSNYPRTAPKIRLQTYLAHPNVFGRWICLDMLEGEWYPDDPKKETKTDIGYGWTPAYSIQTVLINLQAFLFDICDTGFWVERRNRKSMTSTVTKARVDSRYFHCKHCSHRGSKPWPEPLAWKERLKYMIPPEEHDDIERTKRQMWNFLENIDSLNNLNKWPKVAPMECGSFFSWTLAPWWDEDYVRISVLNEQCGTMKVKKNEVKLIRALVGNATRWLKKEGRTAPSKSRLCEWMYRIESACDLALNGSTSGSRKRGYWSWNSKSLFSLSNHIEDGDGDVDPNALEAAAKEEQKQDEVGRWIDFPTEINDEIEALYCRFQADCRRPGELVRVLSKSKEVSRKEAESGRKADAYTDLAVVCRPQGYHYHRLYRTKGLSEAEKKAIYKPYNSKTKKVRIMPINPERTTRYLCHWWWNGPYSDIGRRLYVSYTDSNGSKYWKWSVVIDKHRDKLGRWWLVCHPMPNRLDLMGVRTKMHSVNDLVPCSQGKNYKGYMQSENKHYVINMDVKDDEYTVRCVEDSAIYPIRRRVESRDCQELWKEVLRRSQSSGDVELPWTQVEEDEIQPLDKIDPRKYAHICPFIDILFDSDDDDYDDCDEEEQEDHAGVVATTMDDSKLLSLEEEEAEDEPISVTKDVSLPFKPSDPLPSELTEVKMGRIISMTKFSAMVDIGLSQPATLNCKEIPVPKEDLKALVKRWGITTFKNEMERKKQSQGMSAAKRRRLRRKRNKQKQRKKTSSSSAVAVANDDDDDDDDDDELKQEDTKVTEFEFKYDPSRTRNLPKNVRSMSESKMKKSDIIGPLWIDQINPLSQSLSLTMRKPLELFQSKDKVIGYIRSIMYDGLYIDVGCQIDAFLSGDILESDLQNHFIFDVRRQSSSSLNIFIGDELKLEIIESNISRGKLLVKLDLSDKLPDTLNIPGMDFNESKAVYHSMFGLFPDDINEYIFQFVDRMTLYHLQHTCRLFQRIINHQTNIRWELKELRCFHTRMMFNEDENVVLGMGVDVERYKGTNVISGITPRLDGFISNISYFQYNVTRSVYKQPFGYWLPLYICPSHAKKSIPWIKKSICSMMAGVDKLGFNKPPKKWDSYFIIKIIPALMNSMIVKVMKGDLHESIVALEGYTMMYHMLLSFVQEFDELQTFVDDAIENFLLNESFRSKKKTPSLGEWICLLAVSNRYVWSDVCIVYLRENFDRHVKWILNAHKELLHIRGFKSVSKEKRIKSSFHSIQVSLKLCMFHVCFLRLFRFSQRSGTIMSVKQTKKLLDKLHGRPTHDMKNKLQFQTKRIKKLKNYYDFFLSVGIPKPPSDDDLFDWLCQSVDNSERRGYHKYYWYLPKKKKKNNSEAGMDRFEAAAEAWEDKQFGKSTIEAKIKTKKMSTADQMIAAF